jgi:hypothetical protein
MTASRDGPPRELPPRRYRGPYERPDGYGSDYRSAPPIVVYESDPPLDRPRGSIPNSSLYGPDALTPPARGEPPRVIYSDGPTGAPSDQAYGRRMAPPRDAGPPPVIAATPPDGIERRQLSPPQSIAPSGPRAGIDARGEPGPQDGMLPPPPERFPQRALPPAAKPAPPKRAAAAPPKQAPLPKPRPPEATKIDAAPAPSSGGESSPAPAASGKKPAIDQMPH